MHCDLLPAGSDKVSLGFVVPGGAFQIRPLSSGSPAHLDLASVEYSMMPNTEGSV